jgi:hypothetical protein
MNTDNNFQWTDELVKEFALRVSLERVIGCSETGKLTTIESFKQSKQPKKDYEIISVLLHGGYIEKNKHEFDYLLNNHEGKKYGAKIHSVKRLKDNFVFTIGDKVVRHKDEFCENPDKTIRKIKEFFFDEKKELKFIAEDNSKYFLSLFSKPKQPLFTTDDGVDMYEGEMWSLSTNNWSKCKVFVSNNPFRGITGKELKYFSTEEAANEYILMNKPMLSLNDLLSVWDFNGKINREHYKTQPLFLRFKELAKEKNKEN